MAMVARTRFFLVAPEEYFAPGHMVVQVLRPLESVELIAVLESDNVEPGAELVDAVALCVENL